LGVSQTLRRWTEGATYIRQGGHHVGHWPTFLVSTCTAHCIVVVLARLFVICLGFMLFTNDNKSSCYFVIMVSVVDGANLIYIQVMACFWLWSSYFSHIAFWWLLFIYHMHVYCTAWNKIHCDRQKHDSLLSSLSCSLLICVELCHVVIVTCMNFTHTHTAKQLFTSPSICAYCITVVKCVQWICGMNAAALFVWGDWPISVCQCHLAQYSDAQGNSATLIQWTCCLKEASLLCSSWKWYCWLPSLFKHINALIMLSVVQIIRASLHNFVAFIVLFF